MEFWNSTLTEKSWEKLVELREKKFNFIVIGGWAAYLWTSLHKSKDIDIAVRDFNDLAFLKKNYNLVKNDNLKKYEIKFEEIDLDIYVPHFSKLAMPVEDIKEHASKIQNFDVVSPAALLVLKQGAEHAREKSVKGEKDRVDIITLLFYADINFREYFGLLERYNLKDYYSRLKAILQNFKEIKYINMSPREFKLKKKEIMEKLKR